MGWGFLLFGLPRSLVRHWGNVGWRMAVVLLVGRIFVTFVSSGIPGFCPLGLRADWVADWNQGMMTISWIVSIAIVVEAIL